MVSKLLFIAVNFVHFKISVIDRKVSVSFEQIVKVVFKLEYPENLIF